jgi:ArsR family transcriptional regulator, arsenate/arsenite/antimonite-responsive transcriptional repressor
MTPDPSPELLAARLGALSHPARLAILRHLSAANCACCKDVVGRLDLAQSTVSQHLKVLVEAGLIRMKADRQRSLYEVDGGVLRDTASHLTELAASCCGEIEDLGDRSITQAAKQPQVP